MKNSKKDIPEIKFNNLLQNVKDGFYILRDDYDTYFSSLGFSLIPEMSYEDNLIWEGFIFSWKKDDLIVMLELQKPHNSLELYFGKIINNDHKSAHSKKYGNRYCLDNYLLIEGMKSFNEDKDNFNIYTKNYFKYSKEIMSHGHLKLILENKFWHDYYFHFRDLMDGGIRRDHLTAKLAESLKKYGM